MIFYDFEVTQFDWLVVFVDMLKKKETVIVNDVERLRSFYNHHQQDLYVGYNNTHYDTYIYKALLLGHDPYRISEHIISYKLPPHEFDKRLSIEYPIINYDVFRNKNMGSLKKLEGMMGVSIEETKTSFNINRPLTDTELQEMISYCRYDVEQTIEIYLYTIQEFNSQIALIKTFNLDKIAFGYTQAKLAALILNAKKQNRYDDWQIKIPECLKLVKYKYVADWFLDKNNYSDNKNLTTEISKVKHIFGWGGLHGSKQKYNATASDDEMFVMADVDQLYPSIMIQYDLLSRNVSDKNVFKNILDTSLRLKKEKRKTEREPYKRICNITYGAMGDKYNDMYDPLNRRLVCVYGQLLLLDLIEHLEPYCELIQSNTDGILIKIKKSDYNNIDDIVYEWENRTGLHMSFENYKTVFQPDVNNYILVDYDGKLKTKGAYCKEISKLDADLPIVKTAIVNYLTKGIPPEETINNCDTMIQFQKIIKIGDSYERAYHKMTELQGKYFRVFASSNNSDGTITKKKHSTFEKIANIPYHCFIDNSNIINKKVNEHLDKQWYIDFVNNILEKKFNVKVMPNATQQSIQWVFET